MKFTILGIVAIAVAAFALSTAFSQTSAETIKVSGCLVGNGSDASPWALKGAILPGPTAAAPAGGGAGGGQAAAGGRGGGGRGGDGAGQAAAGGRGGGGRGGDGGGRGAAPGGGAAAAPGQPAQPARPPVDLKLIGVDMQPWRNMYVEVEGTLGPRPASGLREFKVNSAKSTYGDCR